MHVPHYLTHHYSPIVMVIFKGGHLMASEYLVPVLWPPMHDGITLSIS